MCRPCERARYGAFGRVPLRSAKFSGSGSTYLRGSQNRCIPHWPRAASYHRSDYPLYSSPANRDFSENLSIYRYRYGALLSLELRSEEKPYATTDDHDP